MSREDAKTAFNHKGEIDLAKFKGINFGLITKDKRTHTDFKTYNFKKLRPVIWAMAKLRIVPYTFFKKYCF
jgi:hypothetical protein